MWMRMLNVIGYIFKPWLSINFVLLGWFMCFLTPKMGKISFFDKSEFHYPIVFNR